MNHVVFIVFYFISNNVIASEGAAKANAVYFSLINFILLVVGLYFILKKPVKDFFKERNFLVKKGFEDAKQLKETADLQIEEYSSKIRNVETEVSKIIDEIRNEGELERNKIVSDAQKMAERLKMDSQKLIEQEFRKAKEKLKQEVIQLSVQLASEKIKQDMSETQQSSIVQSYLNKMEQTL